jgi:tetratricopeptide (TPR) repeat protein
MANDADTKKAIEEIRERTNRVIADRFEAEKVLREQLEATKRRLPEFAEELARVNLDFASEMYKKAYAFFKAGDIDKAIETLDEAVLDEQARIAMEQLDSLDNAMSLLDSAMAMTESQLLELIKTYSLKARSHHDQHENKLAMQDYHTAIALLVRVKRSNVALAGLYSSAGDLHLEMGGEDSALCYQKLRVGVLEVVGDTNLRGIAEAYQDVAALYLGKGIVDSTVQYLDLAYRVGGDSAGLDLREKAELAGEIVDLLLGDAKVMEVNGDYGEAARRYGGILRYPISEELRKEVERKMRKYRRKI